MTLSEVLRQQRLQAEWRQLKRRREEQGPHVGRILEQVGSYKHEGRVLQICRIQGVPDGPLLWQSPEDKTDRGTLFSVAGVEPPEPCAKPI